MREFRDCAGRKWNLSLTLGSAMRLKEKMGIDLLQPEQGDPPLLTRLGTDELLLGEVLCSLLEQQFDDLKVTVEQVRDSFDGETLMQAQKAFYEELSDFFQHRGRPDRAKAVAAQAKVIQAAVAAMEVRIDAIDVDKAIAGLMSGELPEASGSTPGA